MVIFLFGENTFGSRRKLVELQDAFVQKFDKSRMNTTQLRADVGATVSDVAQATMQSPFLGEKRFVAVCGALAGLKKDDAKPWLELLSRIPESTILVFWDDMTLAAAKKHAVLKAKIENRVEYGFAAPGLGDVSREVRKMLSEATLQMEQTAFDALLAMIGTDLWRADQEIKKLSAYCAGRVATEEDVEKMVHGEYSDQIFDLMDAISQKDRRKAARIMRNQRRFGSADEYLLAMLARQVRLLTQACDAYGRGIKTSQGMADVLKVHPFVAQKLTRQVVAFSKSDLTLLHKMLFVLDGRMKSSAIDAEAALDRLFVQMTATH